MFSSSPPLLLAVLVVALLLALVLPLYNLLFFDLMLTPVSDHSSLGGVLLNPSDVVFGALLFGIALRGRISLRETSERVPYFRLWVLLGVLLCLAYIHAPENRERLTALHRIVYQLYRYGWKPILFYFLTVALIPDAKVVRKAMTALMLTGVMLSLMGIVQYFQGQDEPGGPFPHGNALGGALIVPFVIAFGRLISPGSSRERAIALASLLLMGRALLYTGSRGGYVGLVAACTVFLWHFSRRTTGRRRLVRLAPTLAAVVLVVLVLKPDILERPTVRRFMTVTKPLDQETMTWRFQNRWPRYWERALDSPWLGYATDIDPALHDLGGAVTPHNGYLSLLLINGFPGALIYLVFAGLGIRNALRYTAQHPLSSETATGIVIAAGLVGILVHNLADSTITLAFIAKTFWLLIGSSSILAFGEADLGATRSASTSPAESVRLRVRPATGSANPTVSGI